MLLQGLPSRQESLRVGSSELSQLSSSHRQQETPITPPPPPPANQIPGITGAPNQCYLQQVILLLLTEPHYVALAGLDSPASAT